MEEHRDAEEHREDCLDKGDDSNVEVQLGLLVLLR